ncbi:hypothetical protein BgiMline_007664 [Biomphalaria glabrata]|nr:hypothetical protein BgiMline_023220 [Biomphalaria glabrata]
MTSVSEGKTGCYKVKELPMPPTQEDRMQQGKRTTHASDTGKQDAAKHWKTGCYKVKELPMPLTLENRMLQSKRTTHASDTGRQDAAR